MDTYGGIDASCSQIIVRLRTGDCPLLGEGGLPSTKTENVITRRIYMCMVLTQER